MLGLGFIFGGSIFVIGHAGNLFAPGEAGVRTPTSFELFHRRADRCLTPARFWPRSLDRLGITARGSDAAPAPQVEWGCWEWIGAIFRMTREKLLKLLISHTTKSALCGAPSLNKKQVPSAPLRAGSSLRSGWQPWKWVGGAREMLRP